MHSTVAQRTSFFRTFLLFSLFGISLFWLTSVMYFALVFVKHVIANRRAMDVHDIPIDFWQPNFFIVVFCLTVFVVSIGCLLKFKQLLEGIAPLVDLLGGRRASSEIAEEQIFLDVVEELALTAGIPIPVAIVIEKERALNAFAMGDIKSQTVVGVTEGMLLKLSRDELQAVVAHEVAHLINGDATLGLRIVSLLHGMVGIANFGFFLCEVGSGERTLFSKEKPPGKPRSNFVYLMFGLVFAVAGFAGLIAGEAVKRLITRGREYGADREACSLLGDSKALIGALLKIEDSKSTSALRNRDAKLCAHMFFADVNKPVLLNKISTHPSLVKRIRRLDPEFSLDAPPKLQQSSREVSALVLSDKAAAGENDVVVEQEANEVAQAIQHLHSPVVGTVGPLKSLLNSVPRELRRALHQVETAIPVVYCLLLDSSEEIQKKQVETLDKLVSDNVKAEMETAYASLYKSSFAVRFVLTSIVVETLRQLSVEDYRRIREVVFSLVDVDTSSDLSSYLLSRMIVDEMDAKFEMERVSAEEIPSIDDAVLNSIMVVSLLGSAKREVDQARAALTRALQHLAFEDALENAKFENSSVKLLDSALYVLSSAPVSVRVSVLEGIGECLAEDGIIDGDEMTLMHVLAKNLSIAVPLLFQGAKQDV